MTYSSLEPALLITIGMTLAVGASTIWTRAKAQIVTRRWMRYLQRWGPRGAVFPKDESRPGTLHRVIELPALAAVPIPTCENCGGPVDGSPD
jgi:hypothetical protein